MKLCRGVIITDSARFDKGYGKNSIPGNRKGQGPDHRSPETVPEGPRLFLSVMTEKNISLFKKNMIKFINFPHSLSKTSAQGDLPDDHRNSPR